MVSDDPQGLPQRVATGFQKIALVMRHEAWRAAGGRGLTPTQAQVISIISNADTPIGLAQVSSELALTPGTVSEAVRVLVEKGLVEKSRHEHDRRAIRLRLTRKGKREAGTSSEAVRTIVDAVRSMNSEQQNGLIRGLIATIRSLQEQGQIPVARMCVGCTFFRPNVHIAATKSHHCEYIDAPIGDSDLRLECKDFEPADAETSRRLWASLCEHRPLLDGDAD